MMVNKYYILVFLIATLLISQPLYAHTTSSYMRRHSSIEEQNKFKAKYGYMPYYFSDNLRSRYTYSAEEKGHYILGKKEKCSPFCMYQ